MSTLYGGRGGGGRTAPLDHGTHSAHRRFQHEAFVISIRGILNCARTGVVCVRLSVLHSRAGRRSMTTWRRRGVSAR